MVNQYCEVSDDELTTSFIEYKELEIADFPNFEVRKDFLDIGNKYLSEVANDYIDLDESNTVVINSSVGQGKSVLAIEIAKDYYLQKNEVGDFKYTIIFAAPYKTLVEQYIEKITSAIKETGNEVNIPDYAKLELESDNINQINDVHNAILSRMHVVTVNFLLANPGDDAIEQNFVKRDYLKGIIKECVKEKRKVIIIFDEIHDAIYNFKQEYIFYLWRFKTHKFNANKILHKAFILSATFNEASKVVIKYIAELTDKKLQIIETPRIQQKDNLSNLHIHLTKNSSYEGYNFENEEFIELFNRIIVKHKNLNILSFSQKLCRKIASGENGKEIRDLLLTNYDSINICIAEEHHPSKKKKKKKSIPSTIIYSNKYVPGMCNIGTTFKTGISIEEENSGFVIILPSENSMQKYYVKSGDYGIFTTGIIPIIQALARVRKKSDIYVIMPFPKQYIRESGNLSLYIANEDYIWQVLKNNILKHSVFMDFKWSYIHHLYPKQYELLSQKYNEIRKQIKKEIKAVERIENKRNEEMLPFLKYPTLDMFILEKGEKYLYTTFAIFGKDLPAYMIWAAYNNQFVNCKLKELSSSNIKERVELKNVLEFIYSYVNDNYDVIGRLTIYDYAIYNSIYQRISSEFELYEYDKDSTNFIKLSEDQLKRYVMTFVQMAIKGNERLHNIYYEKDNSSRIKDKAFEASDYLFCCMANAMQYKKNENEIIDVYTDDTVIKSYNDLYYKVRKIFIDKILKRHNSIKYIYPTFDKFAQNTNTPLNNTEINLILQTIKTIKEQDIHFKCFRKFQSVKFNDINKDLNSIYSELKELFFILKKGQKLPVSRNNVDFINEIIELPAKRTGLNLLYKYKYIRDENYDDDILGEILANEYVPSDEELGNMVSCIIEENNFNEEEYVPSSDEELEAMSLYIEEDDFNEDVKQSLKEFRENRNISDNQ